MSDFDFSGDRKPDASTPVDKESNSANDMYLKSMSPRALSKSLLPVITPDTVNHWAAGAVSDDQHAELSPSDGIRQLGFCAGVVVSSASVVSCNCKKSKCLKLYCDCFAALSYCDTFHCNCLDCANNVANEKYRQEAIRATKDRNSFAFQTKIEKKGHTMGCHCKNSQCLKKYCECFNGGAFCGINCKCQSCQNFKGSKDLEKSKASSNSVSTVHSRDSTPNINTGAKQLMRKRNEVLTSDRCVRRDSMDEMDTSVEVEVGSAVHHRTKLAWPKGKLEQMSSLAPAAVAKVSPLCNDRSAAAVAQPHATDCRFSESDLQTVAANCLLTDLSGGDRGAQSHRSGGTKKRLAPTADSGAKRNRQRRVQFANEAPICYPFFGEQLPAVSKVLALKCLDYLEGAEIYAMSQVNSLWSQAAVDDALWE